jgi:hypothetical protein
MYVYMGARTGMMVGWGSVVGVVTHHGLDGSGIGFRWGTRFSTPVQTGLGAHPASYIMDTLSVFRG